MHEFNVKEDIKYYQPQERLDHPLELGLNSLAVLPFFLWGWLKAIDFKRLNLKNLSM